MLHTESLRNVSCCHRDRRVQRIGSARTTGNPDVLAERDDQMDAILRIPRRGSARPTRSAPRAGRGAGRASGTRGNVVARDEGLAQVRVKPGAERMRETPPADPVWLSSPDDDQRCDGHDDEVTDHDGSDLEPTRQLAAGQRPDSS
jgi:hypothetical protein